MDALVPTRGIATAAASGATKRGQVAARLACALAAHHAGQARTLAAEGCTVGIAACRAPQDGTCRGIRRFGTAVAPARSALRTRSGVTAAVGQPPVNATAARLGATLRLRHRSRSVSVCLARRALAANTAHAVETAAQARHVQSALPESISFAPTCRHVSFVLQGTTARPASRDLPLVVTLAHKGACSRCRDKHHAPMIRATCRSGHTAQIRHSAPCVRGEGKSFGVV